jgi:hypothetical protein
MTQTDPLPLTDRVDRFQRAHPDVIMAAPWANPSGRWEVSEPDTPAKAYDRGVDMMSDLEARYPDRQ